MRIKFEDVILGIGILSLILMLYWKGIERVLDMVLSFLISACLFYFVARKIERRLEK